MGMFKSLRKCFLCTPVVEDYLSGWQRSFLLIQNLIVSFHSVFPSFAPQAPPRVVEMNSLTSSHQWEQFGVNQKMLVNPWSGVLAFAFG